MYMCVCVYITLQNYLRMSHFIYKYQPKIVLLLLTHLTPVTLMNQGLLSEDCAQFHDLLQTSV